MLGHPLSLRGEEGGVRDVLENLLISMLGIYRQPEGACRQGPA